MTYWITRDGTRISLKDMEWLHIVNCIRMMERNIQYANDARPWYAGDSDGAVAAAACEERNIDDYIEEANAKIDAFRNELSRRARKEKKVPQPV